MESVFKWSAAGQQCTLSPVGRVEDSRMQGTIELLWRRFAPFPGGKRLFSVALGWLIPYSGTIGARVECLEPGHALLTLPERRRNKNHLGSIHAAALMNFAELASGLAFVSSLPPNMQAIVVGFEIEYIKKARGKLSAEVYYSDSILSERSEYSVPVEILDQHGELVVRATARWKVREEAQQ